MTDPHQLHDTIMLTWALFESMTQRINAALKAKGILNWFWQGVTETQTRGFTLKEY